LLTRIQGHENANKQGLSVPKGTVCGWGQYGKKETMAKNWGV